MKKPYIFETEIHLKKPLEEVFQFFEKAENLEKLTPGWLKFQILTPLPITLDTGRIIEYKIKLFGIPFHWKTRINLWQRNRQFQDEQLKGPYQKWVHTHSFAADGENTIMADRVEYIPKGWIFSPLINFLFVSNQVKRIFLFREQKITSLF